MQVEDHPVEYGEFEGVIPAGYGAGIVMLWDRGTWTPEVDDVDAALRKGDLKISLNGYKLKGSWVLVRTRGWGASSRGGSNDARSWLLIKHRDEWAGEVDITEFAPMSVKGGGDFADILATGQPEIWQSHRPAQSGDAGRMFERIIERALDLRNARGAGGDTAAGADAPAAQAASARKPSAPKTSSRKTASPRTASRRTASRKTAPPAAARKKTAAARKRTVARGTSSARKTTSPRKR
jgi:bifunctional non-homologous end joining protein LigD